MADYQTFPTAQPLSTAPAYSLDPATLASIQQWAANPTLASGLTNAAGGLSSLDNAGPAYDPSMVYKFNTGGTGASGDTYTPVVFQPGQNYTLTDSSGKTIGTASTPEQMQQLVKQSGGLSSWNLLRDGQQIANQTNSGSFGSMIVPMLSIAALGTGLGALGVGAGGAAGAEAAGGLGGAAGATGAAGTATGAGLGATGAGLGAGLGAAEAAPLITVMAPAAGGLSAGALGALGATAAGAGALSGLGGGSTASSGTSASAAPQDSPIVVNAAPPAASLPASVPAASGLGAIGAAAAPSPAPGPTVANSTEDPNQIVVTGAKTPPVTSMGAAEALAGIGGLGAGALSNLPGATATPSTQKPQTWEQKLAKYLELAGYGSTILGGIFGGGGHSGATIPGGLGTLNPIFSKQLPSANMPGAGNLSPRVMPQQDWNRYAFHPEQSFYNNVPQNPAGYAQGGNVHGATPHATAARTDFAVNGPGDGRSDDIPAKLSDGEYVMDAETVSMLGNGSNKAGADKLDQFRVNIRKHKASQLTKGKMSPDAKQPAQYLSGGKA